MNDDQYLLASAYLDGELSADDWARAAADPEVMALVEEMRSLAGAVAEAEPPSAAARNQAIGAALAELRTAPAPRAAARRPVGTWLGVAAAAVAVLAVGAVVATVGRGGDDDFDAGGEQIAATAEMADTYAGADITAEPVAPADADLATEGGLAPGAEEPGELTAEATSERVADDASSMFLESEGVPTAPPSPTFDESAPLASANDLSAYGTHLLVLEAQGDMPPTPNTHCPGAEQVGVVDVLDEALYVVDDVAVPVLIAVDRTSGLTLALDPATCAVVADNRMP